MPIRSRLWCCLALVLPIMAQDRLPVAADPLPLVASDTHQEDRLALRAILGEVEKGINDQDIERIISQMDPTCTVTWWNAEISRGPNEIRAYYRRMVKDSGRLITKYTTQAKVDAPARFLGPEGDIAVADGSMEDEFFPVIRGPFKLSSRWTATIAKSNGQWKIVNLHMSSNVFTNTLISELTRALWYAGAAGLVIGVLAGWFLRRPRRA